MRPKEQSPDYLRVAQKIATVIVLLFVFLVGIKGMGDGFKMLGKDMLGAFFSATENPFVALVVGILATTLVQSSSVTTSMIVAMVAAPENPLPITNAVPMVMGANIGTTVTNTIVSLGHMARKNEFKRAFSVATCHDFFNFMAVAIFLPLEMATGFLSKMANFFASGLGDVGGMKYESPLNAALKLGELPIKGLAGLLFADKVPQAIIVILLSAGIIFASLMLLVKVLRAAMRTRVEAYVSRALGVNPLVSMIVGMVVTVMVQSSSITTSLLVPLAGTGLITLVRAFPITLGANVGTTVTSVLAALAVSGPNAGAGIRIALVHLLFNLLGILVIYPIPQIRALPLGAATWLAETAVNSRRWAIAYVALLFYGLPGVLVFLHKVLS